MTQKILAKREKAILFTTIAVVIFSLAFNFLIAPILKSAELFNRETNAVTTKLKKYARLLSQKAYIEEKYNKFASGLNLTDESKGTSAAPLSVLENLAKDADIHIIDIRPEIAKEANLYKQVLIDLKTEGSIEGYLKFIYDIENSLSLLRIKRFQISAKANSQNLEGTFTISQLSFSE